MKIKLQIEKSTGSCNQNSPFLSLGAALAVAASLSFLTKKKTVKMDIKLQTKTSKCNPKNFPIPFSLSLFLSLSLGAVFA
jgi:hypothetical protein